MPCSYVIESTNRLVRTSAFGVVTYEQAEAHDRALQSDPLFDPSFDQLIDAASVTSVLFSLTQARLLARNPVFSTTSRRAAVATVPSVFAMLRFMEVHYELAFGVNRTGVFRDLDSALLWLGGNAFSDNSRS